MKTKTYLTILLFIFASCSSRHGTTNRKVILNAVRSGSLEQLQKKVGDHDLDGKSELHNVLASSCHTPIGVYAAEKARFLLKKKSMPMEKEILDPALDDNQYSEDINSKLKGPLVTSLYGGCEALAKVYLEEMSAEDIANGSLAYHGTSTNELLKHRMASDETNKNNPGHEDPNWELKFIQAQPGVYETADLVIKKNETLCSARQPANCKAFEHLKTEIAITHSGVAGISLLSACQVRVVSKQEKALLQKQEAYEERAGIAVPAQDSEKMLSYYKYAYESETHRPFDSSLCQR